MIILSEIYWFDTEHDRIPFCHKFIHTYYENIRKDRTKTKLPCMITIDLDIQQIFLQVYKSNIHSVPLVCPVNFQLNIAD